MTNYSDVLNIYLRFFMSSNFLDEKDSCECLKWYRGVQYN